ncbi:MAG: hypothetical protein IKW91_10035, partial [Bacteroidaceae bacterium]|nr:hypothetical protein [Bacteroidaceae bacterium]
MLAIIYLSLLLLTSIPSFQRWSAGVASHYLEEKVGSRVSINNLKLNMLGRIVLDNVKLYDKRDTLMLQASRIAAKIDLMPLIEKKIRISGAQLIGTKAKIYKDGDGPFNFQFLVDAFSSKDTTSTPLDLAIGALVVRRGDVWFDKTPSNSHLKGENKGENASGHKVSPLRGDLEGSFDPNHLHLSDLSLTARVHFKKPDSLAIDLRNLSFKEQSGLDLKHLSFEAEVGKNQTTVRDLQIKLPNSALTLAQLNGNVGLKSFKKKEDLMKTLGLEGNITGYVCPRNVECLAPQLQSFSDVINLSTEFNLANNILRLPNLSVKDNNGNISLVCDATIQDIKAGPSVFADIEELRTGAGLQQFLTENLQGQAREISPILSQLGSTKSTGTIAYQDKELRTNLLTESEMGEVSLNGTLYNMQEIEAKVAAKDLQLGNLLDLQGENKGTALSVEANVLGSLPSKGKQAKLMAKGLLNSLIYNGYEHRNIPFTATLDGDAINGELKIDEPNGQALVHLQTAKQQGKRSLVAKAQLKDFAPHNMRLTKGY